MHGLSVFSFAMRPDGHSFASLLVYEHDDIDCDNDKDLRVVPIARPAPASDKTDRLAVRITIYRRLVVMPEPAFAASEPAAPCRSCGSSLRLDWRSVKLNRRMVTNKADPHSDLRFGSVAPITVKDTRTKLERGNVDAVLGGDIDDFIKAYLLARRAA